MAASCTLPPQLLCASVPKNLGSKGRGTLPFPSLQAPARPPVGGSQRLPPQKRPKTNEKSMIRALEPPGTSPERSRTTQDHVKARVNHPRAAQDHPVRPPRRPVRPPRRHVVCPGSSSVCPGSNSVCAGNTKFIEIPLEK